MALSYVQYPGDGTTQTFAVPFEYLDKTHIQVSVALDSHPFTWDDPNTIRITPAPAVDAVVEVRRSTPREFRMVDFVDGSVLTESDLDLANLQTFYIVQEAIDIAGGTLELLSDGSYGAGGRRIKNLGTAIEPRDAITKEYHDGTFLPQMNALLSQSIVARDGAVTARQAAETALAAAVAARDLALQYRDTTKGYRDEVAAWNTNVNAKSANVDAKSANVDAKAATVDTQAAQVAADRTATQGFRNAASGFADAAEASAIRAATFDPASYYTKVQVYTKSEVDGKVTTLTDSVAAAASNANGRVAKSGDTMTGSLWLNYANPTLNFYWAGVKHSQWWMDGSGTMILRDGGSGQNHFYVTAGGAVWTQQLGDLNSRIEARAEAWSAARRDEANSYAASLHNAQQGDVNERVHRITMVGYGESASGGWSYDAPVVVNDVFFNGYACHRRVKTMQMHIPAQGGWVNVWSG